MRIYSNLKDLFTETVREVFARGQITFDPTVQGIRVPREEYEMKEIIGYAYKLTDWYDMVDALEWWRVSFNKEFVSYDTALKWSEDMMKPINPDQWWRGAMDEYWSKFSTYGKVGRFEYTYGERIYPYLHQLIEDMKRNPYGRGHFIAVWYPHDTGVSWRRPCTIGYQFIWREPRGYLIAYQRSCDLVNFFPLDVAKAILFGDRVFQKAGLRMTHFIHFIGSLHAYKIDVPEHLKW
jgi:thymidylate synthase